MMAGDVSPVAMFDNMPKTRKSWVSFTSKEFWGPISFDVDKVKSELSDVDSIMFSLNHHIILNCLHR